MIIKKNILYIKNFPSGENLENLKNIFDVNIKCIESKELIILNIDNLKKLIESYDIIILGGGNQHLTSNNLIDNFPEIINQIEIVKLMKLYKNKLLIGICLGCQIIGLSFGLEIIKMKVVSIGYDYLDINSIDYDYVNKYDKYLSKIDFKLLSNSFSFHSDCVKFNYSSLNKVINKETNSNELIKIAESIDKIPYIIKHSTLNIYGFQFHPEISYKSIKNIVEIFSIDKNKFIYENKQKIILDKCLKHFFDVFINN